MTLVAFGLAADGFAQYVADGHIGTAIGGFAFAARWVWINFFWFAFAYDTEDWSYRLCTMVQVAGVVILARHTSIVRLHR